MTSMFTHLPQLDTLIVLPGKKVVLVVGLQVNLILRIHKEAYLMSQVKQTLTSSHKLRSTFQKSHANPLRDDAWF